MKKVIKFDNHDNVMTALEEIRQGDGLRNNGQDLGFSALNDVPVGHKIASTDIKKDELIFKFNVPIGRATRDIRQGEYVHTQNVQELLNDWGHKGYDYNADNVKEVADAFILDPEPKLYGYKRKNGQVGFRNHLVVISTVICANKVIENISKKYPKVISIPNESGCMILPSETERIKTTLLTMARNPNVGAIIFVGLGCEYLDAEMMANEVKDDVPAAYVRIQDESSSMKATKKAEKLIKEMSAVLKKQKREKVGLDAIAVGTKCGGSDWTSGVSSNPAIGYASDVVIKANGTSFIGETQGWFGGEQMLIPRARSQETADDIVDLLKDIYDRCLAAGRKLGDNNPTPGNKEGGITTLVEKALGNVKKSGTAPIEGVLRFGEQPSKKGLYVMDNPGLDPLSVLGETCASANIIVFSTGRGTPTGTPLAPVIKISASKHTCETFGDHIDIDLCGIIDGRLTIEEAGKLIFDEMIAVANGKLTKSEIYGHREFALPLLMGVL